MKEEDKSYLLGVDLGTTCIKGLLIDSEGSILASVSEEYTLDYGENQICELDAETYWRVTCKVILSLLSESGVAASKVKGLAFSSQGETIIPVDRNGTPLRKAIIWLDNRSTAEAGDIEKRFGNQLIMDRCGQPEILPIWPATRILWLKRNEPEVFNKVHKYLLVEDYLMFRMTGRYCTEHSLVSSTLYFDINQKKWWKEMLDFLGISEDKLPELLKSGVPVGSLTAEASAATGLTSKTICVSGAYDHPSGAIGTGNMQSGDVTLTIGASMAMCVAIDKPITDISYKIPCQCHVVDGLFFLLPYGQTAGMVLKWFRNEFCKAEIDIAREKGEDAYDLIVKEAALVPPGCDGLIMLPHLMGAGTPEYNSNARGVFAGIDISMKKGHFTRAIIESVSMMIHNNLERLKEQGINVKSLYVLGGGSRSKLWNQILADITGLVFITLSSSENAAIGAAMLAGVGTGIYENLREATKVSIKAFERIKPNIKNHEKYKEVFKKYLKLYQSLENYW